MTNDIFTREDAEFLTRHEALPARADPRRRDRRLPARGHPRGHHRNLLALEELMTELHRPSCCSWRAGGDNLAAHFSRELADYTIYVIDVAGGDKVPRKGGPGITQSDLLVINKTDLAPARRRRPRASWSATRARMRGQGPVVFAQVTRGVAVDEIAGHVLHALQHATGTPHQLA